MNGLKRRPTTKTECCPNCGEYFNARGYGRHKQACRLKRQGPAPALDADDLYPINDGTFYKIQPPIAQVVEYGSQINHPIISTPRLVGQGRSLVTEVVTVSSSPRSRIKFNCLGTNRARCRPAAQWQLLPSRIPPQQWEKITHTQLRGIQDAVRQ